MAKELSQTKSFYELFKILDSSDRNTLVTTRSSGTEADVVTILDGWKTSHSNADVRSLCDKVLADIA